MGFDRIEWVWMNGELRRWSEATIHVSAHGLHYGSGVFEGMRCYATPLGPAVFRMRSHLERLYASAAVYGLEIPFTPGELGEAVRETILANKLAACYVRPICTSGSGTLGLDPGTCPVDVAVLAWPWAPLLGDEAAQNGVRVTLSPWVKFDERMMPPTAKACGQYLNSILAVRDARARGFDEALLVNTDGLLAEGPGENVFIVRGGTVHTNDERSSILLGVTRDSVLRIAADLGLEVEIGRLRLEDLLAADEAFFTGTAAEVVPIREVDGALVGCGARGPVTERIQRVFADAASGRDPRYAEWLDPVVRDPVVRDPVVSSAIGVQVEKERPRGTPVCP
jgi:branched-chain amino acid aminotransferase